MIAALALERQRVAEVGQQLRGPGARANHRMIARIGGALAPRRRHATRADLLRRLNRDAEAAAAYDRAIALAENAAERAFLAARRATLG